jgi:hypothetical protein
MITAAFAFILEMVLLVQIPIQVYKTKQQIEKLQVCSGAEHRPLSICEPIFLFFDG